MLKIINLSTCWKKRTKKDGEEKKHREKKKGIKKEKQKVRTCGKRECLCSYRRNTKPRLKTVFIVIHDDSMAFYEWSVRYIKLHSRLVHLILTCFSVKPVFVGAPAVREENYTDWVLNDTQVNKLLVTPVRISDFFH